MTDTATCLYHSRGGRALLEHTVNTLVKLSLFTPEHKTLLRRGTCSCDASLSTATIPVDALAPPGGLDELVGKLKASGYPAIASLTALLTPNPVKDSTEMVKSKTRLMAVVLRFLEPQNSPEDAGGPFGFSSDFVEEQKAKRNQAQQQQQQKPVVTAVSSGLLSLRPNEVGTFIRTMLKLGIPPNIKVHIEDDKVRSKGAHRNKEKDSIRKSWSWTRYEESMSVDGEGEEDIKVARTGVVKVTVSASLLDKKKKKKKKAKWIGGTSSRYWLDDPMVVDDAVAHEEEGKGEEEQDVKVVLPESKEVQAEKLAKLQKSTDSVLALLVALSRKEKLSVRLFEMW
jgi:hypothetical protein